MGVSSRGRGQRRRRLCLSDVVSGAGVGEEAGSRVLDMLEFIEEVGWYAVEDAIAVVESGCDECMKQGFSIRGGE